MKILFLHGWRSKPGGVKPTYLKEHGHEVINPALDDDDFDAAIATAQAEFDIHQPQVVVGSSRGGAVAMNINSGNASLVLICPAWKRWGNVLAVKDGTVILHSHADDVVPFADSQELVKNSGLPSWMLVDVGTDHRLADPLPLKYLLGACVQHVPSEKVGQIIRAKVKQVEIYGIFFEDNENELLVLIPDVSWIPCFSSCQQVVSVGEEFDIRVLHHDRIRGKIAGSMRSVHLESDPWNGTWRLCVGDVYQATVIRWIVEADRCGHAGGYLLAIKPAAFVLLYGYEEGMFCAGDKCTVVITSVNERRRRVTIELVP